MKKPQKRARQKQGAQLLATPDMDEAIAKLHDEVSASAQKMGLQCVLIIQAPDGAWRGRWGQMHLDFALLLVFKLLTAMQRMLP